MGGGGHLQAAVPPRDDGGHVPLAGHEAQQRRCAGGAAAVGELLLWGCAEAVARIGEAGVMHGEVARFVNSSLGRAWAQSSSLGDREDEVFRLLDVEIAKST